MQEGGNALGAAAAAPTAAPDTAVTIESIIGTMQTFAKQKDTAFAQLQEAQHNELSNLRLEVACHKRTIFTKGKEAEKMVICILFILACCACVCCLRVCADCTDVC